MSRATSSSDTCDIYFMLTTVNRLLYTCPLVPFEDGILLDPSLVCMHRCERSYTFFEEEPNRKSTTTPSMRRTHERRKLVESEEKDGNTARKTEAIRWKKKYGLEDPVHTAYPESFWIPRAHGPQNTPCKRDPHAHGADLARAHGPTCEFAGRCPICPSTRPSPPATYIFRP